MSRGLRVYGGWAINTAGKQERVVIAVHNQKEITNILRISLSHINKFWSITGNEKEVELALQNPLTPIWTGALTPMMRNVKTEEREGEEMITKEIIEQEVSKVFNDLGEEKDFRVEMVASHIQSYLPSYIWGQVRAELYTLAQISKRIRKEARE